MTEDAVDDRRDVLASDRRQTLEGIAGLTRDLDAVVEASALDVADDEHDPEGATIGFERAQITSLLAHFRSHLADVDAALARLESGTYGTCRQCGRPIAPDRLAARPATETCIECAEGASRPRLRTD